MSSEADSAHYSQEMEMEKEGTIFQKKEMSDGLYISKLQKFLPENGQTTTASNTQQGEAITPLASKLESSELEPRNTESPNQQSKQCTPNKSSEKIEGLVQAKSFREKVAKRGKKKRAEKLNRCFKSPKELNDYVESKKWETERTYDNWTDIGGNTLLHAAARLNLSHLIISLCHWVPVGSTNRRNQTALHIAAQLCHAETCKVLLEVGCDANHVDDAGNTALHYAAEFYTDNSDCIRTLWKHGKIPCDKKNHDGKMPKDLLPRRVPHDAPVRTMLQPDSEPFVKACMDGDQVTVKHLVKANRSLLKFRGTRNSTGLHIASGYGRTEVVRVLVSFSEIDINAKDELNGTALHNCATFAHTDVADILLDKGIDINHQDINGNTALHDAAKAEHLQLCILLVLKGADTTIKNKESKTAAEMTSSEEIKAVLNRPTNSNADSSHPLNRVRTELVDHSQWCEGDDNDDDDDEIAVRIRRPREWKSHKQGLMELHATHPDFIKCHSMMVESIVQHGTSDGGNYKSFKVLKVHRLQRDDLWSKYVLRKTRIRFDTESVNEQLLFHGSPNIMSILHNGFDERFSYSGGMFGAGIYFAKNSSKSNQYVYGLGGGTGCKAHKDTSCYKCERKLLLCRVVLGRSAQRLKADKLSHAPPGCHSIEGQQGDSLRYPEFVVYNGDQAYPEFLISYKLMP